jgi:hypothetical protein
LRNFLSAGHAIEPPRKWEAKSQRTVDNLFFGFDFLVWNFDGFSLPGSRPRELHGQTRALLNLVLKQARFRVEASVSDLATIVSTVSRPIPNAKGYDLGRFGWFSDPEGNRVELWQPVAAELAQMSRQKSAPKVRKDCGVRFPLTAPE